MLWHRKKSESLHRPERAGVGNRYAQTARLHEARGNVHASTTERGTTCMLLHSSTDEHSCHAHRMHLQNESALHLTHASKCSHMQTNTIQHTNALKERERERERARARTHTHTRAWRDMHTYVWKHTSTFIHVFVCMIIQTGEDYDGNMNMCMFI